MDEALYYLIMGMAVGWALSKTFPKNAPPSEAEDDPGIHSLRDASQHRFLLLREAYSSSSVTRTSWGS